MSPTQIANLQVGDLVSFNGRQRKVRAVSDGHGHKPGDPYFIGARFFTFAILRRSWTNRPYTIYMASDLRSGTVRLVKRDVRLRTTKFERLVQASIEQARIAPPLIGAKEMAGLVT